MKILERLIQFTFKGGDLEESLMASPAMEDFIEGNSAKIQIFFNGKSISLAKGDAKKGKVLTLSRRNKEKINPKKLCFDVSSSVSTFGSTKEQVDKALLSILKIQGLMSVDASIKTRELTKKVKWEERGIDES